MMNIKALRAFRATLSEGSLAAAAEILHLSQPAVSRLISGLEGELRLLLFDRSGRSLTPTKEGLAFYRNAGRILDNLDEIPTIAAEIRAGRNESLRVIAMPRIAQSLVSPAVGQFLRDDSEANITLDIRARREADKWLSGREYDIGIGTLPVDHPDIVTDLLLRVRAQVIIPAHHKLADRHELSGSDLAGEPIIRLMHGLLLRDQLDDIFKSAGIEPKQVCDVASSQLACALVANGGGITIADELIASQVPAGQIKVIPVVPERWMAFGLLYPVSSKQSESRDKFINILRQRVSELAQKSDTISLE